MGFTENTAARHRRGGGREVTVTSKLHTQEYRDIELNIVIDEIGPGEGLLDSGGIEIPLKPAGKGGVAQFPAGSPVQATTCGQSAPMTEVAMLKWQKCNIFNENVTFSKKKRS